MCRGRLGSSDVYSPEAVEKLPLSARAYLLKLFGLTPGGAAKAQARRIDLHVASFRKNQAGQAAGEGGVMYGKRLIERLMRLIFCA